MSVSTSNTFINTSKTYKVDRLLPERAVTDGWQAATTSGSTLTGRDGVVPKVVYPDSGAATTAYSVNLNLKSTKAGESQYVSTAYDGLSPACCVKVAAKNVADVYGYSVLSPEKLNSKVPGVQVLVSLEELFRASRITKVIPASEGNPESYECNDQTGHLPIAGWICVRVPKHMALSEEMIQAYMCDLFGAITTNSYNAGTSFTQTIMSIARGDVRL